MMIKTLSLIFILSFSHVLACDVKGPTRIYKDGNASDVELNKVLSFKNCSKKQLKAFISLIRDTSGKISQRTVRIEAPGITLKNTITLSSFDELINQKIGTPKDWKIIKNKLSHSHSNILALSSEENITLSCFNCTNTGEKNIKGTISNPMTNQVRNIWFTGIMAVKSKSLILKRNLTVDNRPLAPDDFKVIETYMKNPAQLFTKRNQLIFYKLNKGKSKGESIKFSDITPVNLVRINQPVTILLKNNSLTLEGKATAHQSGKLGQVIRLKNNRTKKTIIGKIVDFNKVEVQL